MERLRTEREGAVAYVRRLKQNFGFPFLVLLTSAYMGLKGALYVLFAANDSRGHPGQCCNGDGPFCGC